MAISDAVAGAVVSALRRHDLDALLAPLEQQGLLSRSLAQNRSNLRPILQAAERDHIDLLRPPADFQTWLTGVIRTNLDGSPAKSNTVIARVSTLGALYRALRTLQLMTTDPLLDYAAPAAERRADPLPSPEDLATLLRQARSDPALHAALLLLWHHAVPVTVLLRLKWQAFDLDEGTLLRGDVLSRLDVPTTRALERLLTEKNAGPLYPEAKARFDHLRALPYDSADALRFRIMQTCRAAGLKFIPPGDLRRCALRDHATTAQQAGYRHQANFEKAAAHVRAVEQASRMKGGPPEKG